MPPALYKDFGKEPKDLLSKLYQEPGTWKLESKFKGSDQELFVNPQFDKGAISVDVEFNVKQYNLKTKTTLTSQGLGVAPNATYEAHGLKAELSVVKQELTVEYKVGAISASLEKVTQAGATASVAYQCCDPAVIGANANVDFSKGLKGWGIGARYTHGNYIASLTTETLKKFVTSVIVPVDVAGIAAKVALTTECGGGKPFDFTVGTEFACPICCGNTMRIKVNKALNPSLAIIRKFADGWKGAITFDLASCCKFGVYVVRE